MNQRCSEILKIHDLKNQILNEEWVKKSDKKREDEASYNDKYDKQDYLVLDTITPDSIELADIIHLKDGTLYLCHVKYGFSTDLRELYSQIITSARRLKNDLKDDQNDYLKAIYKGLLSKKKNRGLSEKEFLDLFKKADNIKYVMCISSHLKNKSILTSIEKYKSNIAKISLIQCYTEMRTEYYDLAFEVIKNDACF